MNISTDSIDDYTEFKLGNISFEEFNNSVKNLGIDLKWTIKTTIESLEDETVYPPIIKGELIYIQSSVIFSEDDDGATLKIYYGELTNSDDIDGKIQTLYQVTNKYRVGEGSLFLLYIICTIIAIIVIGFIYGVFKFISEYI